MNTDPHPALARIAEYRAKADMMPAGPWRVSHFEDQYDEYIQTVVRDANDDVVCCSEEYDEADRFICDDPDWLEKWIATTRTTVPDLARIADAAVRALAEIAEMGGPAAERATLALQQLGEAGG